MTTRDRPTTLTLRHVDVPSARDIDVAAFADLMDTIRLERATGDPMRSVQSYRDSLRGLVAFEDVHIDWWFAEIDGQLVGHGFASAAERNDNRHLLHIDLAVAAPYRRRGVGRALLARLVAFARRHERTLLVADTSDRIPAGEHFARWLGADLAIRTHTNELLLADVDRDLLRAWILEAELQAAPHFEVGLWQGVYPEEEIEAIAEMHGVMNSQPRDDLDAEDEVITPRILRQHEVYMASRGIERWSMYTRHRSSGRLVGYSEVFWDPHNPENLGQGDTGVLLDYRGNGLGKWLKAAMLEKVFTERPDVKHIRSGNADSNDAMLAINRALGFRPFTAHMVWQLAVDKAEALLTEGEGS